jgi:tetratricopeptide (TPR) repeat protein
MGKRIALVILICLGQAWLFINVSALIQDEKVSELQSHLREISFEQNSDSLLNITGRLTLIKNRLEAGESPMDNYQYEARMQSLTSGLNLYNRENETDGTEEPIDVLSSAVRFLMGNERVSDAKGDPAYFPHLEEAYYWERNRHYNLAVQKYKYLVIEFGDELKETVNETVLLHLSFSHLMTANYSEAERIADEIITRSDNMVFRITADRINSFLYSLKKKHQQLASLKTDSMELGREQYFSVKYREAVETLSGFLERKNPDLNDEAEARYYLARAQEELGDTESAIKEYQRIILLSEDENISMEAGRRLLMLSSFYDITDEETETVSETLEDYEDPELVELIEPYKELYIVPEKIPAPQNNTSSGPSDEESSEKTMAPTGEIYLTTEPPGAAISINGINFGISPLFITSLPVGEVNVTAEYEYRKAERTIEVTDRIIRKISIDLPKETPKPLTVEQAPPVGKLIAYFDLTDVSVEIDYEPVDIKSGQPIQLDAGEYIFIISGKDQTGKLLFWEDLIVIEKDKETEITVSD